MEIRSCSYNDERHRQFSDVNFSLTLNTVEIYNNVFDVDCVELSLT